MWDVAERMSSSGMWQPRHTHFDILYLGEISEDVSLHHEVSEVDDIRWFDIEGIEKYIAEPRMLYMIEKIKNL
jgi:8-oxo-dGTP pyrophosphatase MutT (NUDIX family)